VRQVKGIYKVKNPALRDLHARAKQLIAQLDWFSIEHALREHNREADRLANAAMDKGMGRVERESPSVAPQEYEGVVANGVVKILNGTLPEGARVQMRLKK
jgi:probable phosphoglycerate mutase